jgi:hypothetical protein
MTPMEIASIELQMKQHRLAYWERHHKLPDRREMEDYLDRVAAA